MAIVKCKPTSAGRRFVVKVVNQELHKGAPHAPLLEKKSKTGGRNNNGRITTRHIGGGHKQHFKNAFLVHASSSSNFFTADTVISTLS